MGKEFTVVTVVCRTVDQTTWLIHLCVVSKVIWRSSRILWSESTRWDLQNYTNIDTWQQRIFTPENSQKTRRLASDWFRHVANWTKGCIWLCISAPLLLKFGDSFKLFWSYEVLYLAVHIPVFPKTFSASLRRKLLLMLSWLQMKLDGCIVLNEHNTVLGSKCLAICATVYVGVHK